MSLLDLFPWFDPTWQWPERPEGGPLTLHLATGEVSGVYPRDRWERLDRFGRPANRRPRAKWCLAYPAWGAVFQLYQEVVSQAIFLFTPFDVLGERAASAHWKTFRPARLTVRMPDGREFVPTGQTTQDEVRAACGEPSDVDRDPGWMGLMYSDDTREIEFSFSDAGLLTAVYVTYFRPE